MENKPNSDPIPYSGGDPGMIYQNIIASIKPVIIKKINFKFENMSLLNFQKNINDKAKIIHLGLHALNNRAG